MANIDLYDGLREVQHNRIRVFERMLTEAKEHGEIEF
jgi:hypothetical protein